MKKRCRTCLTVFLVIMSFLFFGGGVVQAQTRADAQPPELECRLQLNNRAAIINGQPYGLDVPPRVINDYTVLPFRFVAEKILEADVYWEPYTKTVIFIREGHLIKITVGSTEAVVGGDKESLPVAPLIEDGRTLVPLRFLGENFDLDVNYLHQEKTIVLTPQYPLPKEPEEPAEPPVARFKFKNPELTAGQKVEVTDASYDPNGYKILERQWQVEKDGAVISTQSLDQVFQKPPAGTYKVRLKVSNKPGFWSDFFEQELIIHPNKKPEVKSFSADKKTIDQGERINFSYKIDNEEWEEISEQKWSFHHAAEPQNKDLSGDYQPEVFFYPGEYEVSLQVRDEYGNWSDPAVIVIKVTDKVKLGEPGFRFMDPRPGELIINPHKTNFNQYQLHEHVTATKTGPTLFFSNSPEKIIDTGILYQDTLSGSIRVLLHHKNNILDTSKRYRLVVIAENVGPRPAAITQTKNAVAGPSEDVMNLGQALSMRYYQSRMQSSRTILPGKKVLLYDSWPANWRSGQTLGAMFDFQSNAPLKLSVAAVEADFDWDDYEELPILSRDDSHFRGTFPESDTVLQVRLKGDDITKIVLGKDKEGFEAWLEGYDNLTGDRVLNVGNYGMVYRFAFDAEHKAGMLINPRGRIFKGAFQGFDGQVYGAPGIGAFYGLDKASVVGVLDKGRSGNLLYTPPNGSDSPALLIIIPEKHW